MRKTGKVIDFTAYEAVKNKDGQDVIGQDGLVVMKRTVVVDCSFTSEEGTDIKDVYVADMFKEISDEQLQAWKTSGEKVAAYIFCDATHLDDGRWFQKVRCSNLKAIC